MYIIKLIDISHTQRFRQNGTKSSTASITFLTVITLHIEQSTS